MPSWRMAEGGKAVAGALVVAGCLAQRYKEGEILEEIPGGRILGTTSCDEDRERVKRHSGPGKASAGVVFPNPRGAAPPAERTELVTTGGCTHTSKDHEGCDKRCTYCIIPIARIVSAAFPWATGAGGRTTG